MIEALLITLSVSLDSFVASIAYGTDKIKIPFMSALIIDITCCLSLALSLFIGSCFRGYIPSNLCKIISFLILFGLGVYRLFESLCKNHIQSRQKNKKLLKFKLFDFNFVLQIYADETKADLDKSKTLSCKEAFYLALALSLDSLAVGFGSSFLNINYLYTLSFCLILGLLSVLAGIYIGSKSVENLKINLSWLSGVILIILSIIKL